MEIRLKEVISPDDGDLARLSALLAVTFADSNLWLGIHRVKEFLADPGPDRSFHIVVAREGDTLLGGTFFSCAAATGAGFSEYIVLTKEARGKGLSRKLYDYRKALLDRSARQFGHPGCPGLLIEVENPWRIPAKFLEREKQTAMDAMERWRYFHHLGFYRLEFPYIMPPLRPDLQPVHYLDLLLNPWSERLVVLDHVPAEFVLRSVAPTMLGWAPEYSKVALENLRRQFGGRPVRMVPLLEEERRYARS